MAQSKHVIHSRENNSTSTNDLPTFDILCGVQAVATGFISMLQEQGFRYEKDSPIKLIIDVQRGFALHMLETLDRTNLHLIVVTFSMCREYWTDLLDLNPDILIVDEQYEHDFASAIMRAARGEQYYHVPSRKTVLTANERATLRCLARGWSNKHIAKYLNLQEKTITNTLTNIYTKLDISCRAEAILP